MILGFLPEGMKISDQTFISIWRKISVFLLVLDGLPMSQMIISSYIKSILTQKFSKFMITGNAFLHAMAKLENGSGIFFRNPCRGVNSGYAVPGKIGEFFFHMKNTSQTLMKVWYYDNYLILLYKI